MSGLAREIRCLLTAVQFLTRLPVPDPGWEAGRLIAAARYFGLVGAAVGLIGGAVWAASLTVLPAPVAAGLALAAMLAATGALHEDGLADCADGLGGQAGRERALEIMRDSRVGTYGVLALVVVLGLRWTALAGLDLLEGMAAVVLAASAGRALMVAATALAAPARADGLAAGLGRGAGPMEVAAALAVPLALAALLGWPGMLALALAGGASAVLLWRSAVRLGGHTGDVLGAVAAVAETAVLVVLAGAFR